MAQLYSDFRRDWRRWSQAERLTAGAIITISLVGSVVLMLEQL
jgi:hypothetical protein